MLRHGLVSVAFLLALTACGGNSDKDEDGLTKAEEEELGLDPEVADSDGDGLLDGEEVLTFKSDPTVPDTDGDGLLDGEEVNEHGSDPTLEDTDGDGYLDPWEVTEGTDPADDKDRIYKGNWPYNPDKADMKKGKFSGPMSTGDFLFDHKGKDQNRDKVDVFDFAGHGKPIILDVSAQWCGPCQLVSNWLAGNDDLPGAEGYNDAMEADYGAVRKAVKNGDIFWITILSEDNSYNVAGVDAIREWDEDFPNKMIPVLTDDDQEMLEGLVGVTGGFPTGMLLNDKMKVQFIGHPIEAMDLVLEDL